MSTAGRIRFEVAVKGFPKDGAQDSLYGVLADCKKPDSFWKGCVACLPGDGDRPWESLCVRAARPVDRASTGRCVGTRPQHALDTSTPQAPFASECCSRWKKKRSTMPSALWTFRTSPTGQWVACRVGIGVVWSLPPQPSGWPSRTRAPCRLLEVNPDGSVPLLKDEETGEWIADSGKIVDYVEGVFPEPATGRVADSKNV